MKLPFMKLYSYWRSSCSYRVRIALALKEVPYEAVAVHLVRDGGEQHSREYLGINPAAQVPVLEFEEGGVQHRLSQSMAICEFLEERFAERPLLVGTPAERAGIRQLCEMVNAGIQPLQNLAVMLQLRELGVDDKAWCAKQIHAGLQPIETLCAARSTKFMAADQPTLADCFLVPQIYNAFRFGLDVESDFPTLFRVNSVCGELKAFKEAHPDAQSDALVT